MARQSSAEKLQKDLGQAREKRAQIDNRIRELEEKLLEAKRAEIVGIVEDADLTPEQLAEVIMNAKNGVFGVIPGKEKNADED